MAYFLSRQVSSHDTELISKKLSEQLLALQDASLLFAKGLGDPPGDPCIVYKEGRVIRWSASIDFPIPVPQDRDTVLLWRSPAGQFLQSWKQLPDGVMVGGIIPLVRYYQLPGGVPFHRHHPIFGKQSPMITGEPGINGQPVVLNGKTFFYLGIRSDGRIIPGAKAWFCLLGSLLSLVWLMVILNDRIRKQPILTIILAGLFLIGFRMFMILSGFPGSTTDQPLLDPSVLASSFWSDNVLSFFLNQLFLLVFCVIIQRTASRIPLISMARLSGWRRISLILIMVGVTVIGFHLPFVGLRTVFEDSILLPDLTRSIKFNSARITVLAAIIAAGASAWILVQATIRLTLALLLKDVRKTGIARTLFMIFCLFLSYGITGQEYLAQTFGFALMLAIGFSRLGGIVFLPALRLRQVGGLLLLLLITSCIAVGIRSLENDRQRTSMTVFARTLQAERDEFGEFLLGELLQRIRNDAFIRMVADSPLSDKERILRKVYQHHFSGYFSRFRSEVGFYDAAGDRLAGNTPTDLSGLLAGTSRISGDDSVGTVLLRSIESTADGLGKSYVVIVPFSNGTLAVTVGMHPTNAGRPWFLRLMDNETASTTSGGFAYSVIERGEVIYQSDGSEDQVLPERVRNVMGEEWFSGDDMDHLAVPMKRGRTLVVSGSAYTTGRLLTNLSFYLFIALVLMALIRVYGLLLDRIRGNSLTYASRIQIYLSVAFILPLVVTSIAAIRNISLEREKQVTLGNRQEVLTLAQETGTMVSEGNGLTRDLLPRTTVLPKDGYIIYDPDGRRLFSSQPDILESSLMPYLINPVALNRLRRGERFTAIREHVGGLPFQGAYTAIHAGIPDQVVGWLFVPYFDHYSAAEQARIRVLMSILPIAVLVFIAFLFISLRMSQRLTRPIRDISRTLRRTALSSGVIPLEGARADEIGRMMEAYNQMMVNLEQSKVELLATQREADWRDMARQVAHEIRNPLTPIRLKLQRLQQRIRSGRVEPLEDSATIDAVLTQTDILSGIAGSFSALAGFPRLQPEIFDAVAETEKAIELFRDQQEGALVFEPVGGPVMVMFDRPFFSRVLSNLLLNAFQSRTGPVLVEVTIREEADKVIVTVKDDGAGIDPALGDLIFQPRFTTKAGGSGFGLAIARRGLEEGGGHIWFQSKPGLGSEFHISLPRGGIVTP